MEICVKGKNEKMSKTETRYATKYYADLLFLKKPKIIDELTLTIQFWNLGASKGYCNLEDDVDKDPRIFLIEIDNRMSRKQQLLTIAHELVHVKQYATNEMCDEDHRTVVWRRKRVDTTKVDYWDQEFEIEAWGRQEGLYQRYVQHLADARLKFPTPKKKSAVVVTKRTVVE